MIAFFPYLFFMLSKALSNFSCFSFLTNDTEELGIEETCVQLFRQESGENISNKLNCTGAEESHNLEVRIPNRRTGSPFHNSLNK